MDPFGHNLANLLSVRKISKERFSRETRIDSNRIYHYLNTNSNPSIKTLILIADYLGVSLDILCRDNEEMNDLMKLVEKSRE